MSQRSLAKEVGINVSSINFCLKALVEKGWLKMENFSKNPDKLSYAYLLTPTGVSEKAALTRRFLRRKMAEYEKLREEIEALQIEAQLQPIVLTDGQSRQDLPPKAGQVKASSI